MKPLIFVLQLSKRRMEERKIKEKLAADHVTGNQNQFVQATEKPTATYVSSATRSVKRIKLVVF